MLMVMKECSREDLIVHEEALAALRFYKQQVRHIHELWTQQLAAFGNEVEAVVQESFNLQRLRLAAEEEQKRFDTVRLEMCQRLLSWKQERMRQAREEDERQKHSDTLHAEWQRQEDARIAEERAQHKAQVKAFRDEQARQVRKQEEEMERLAAIAEEERLEQAKVNVVRVEVRKDLAKEKQLQLEQIEEQKRLEELAREERLAALRATVQVTAERDPERLISHTVASRAAAAEGEEMREMREMNAFGNHRSFTLNSFNDTQLKADKRGRVEQALRSAGLAGTDYARNTMKMIAPPRPPRRDHFSTVFQQNPDQAA